MLKLFNYILLLIILISCESIKAFRRNGIHHKIKCATYTGSDQVKYDKKYYKCKDYSKIKIHEPK
jgi:hypothetical protein